jgi:hypothetical protein
MIYLYIRYTVNRASGREVVVNLGFNSYSTYILAGFARKNDLNLGNRFHCFQLYTYDVNSNLSCGKSEINYDKGICSANSPVM